MFAIAFLRFEPTTRVQRTLLYFKYYFKVLYAVPSTRPGPSVERAGCGVGGRRCATVFAELNVISFALGSQRVTNTPVHCAQLPVAFYRDSTPPDSRPSAGPPHPPPHPAARVPSSNGLGEAGEAERGHGALLGWGLGLGLGLGLEG